MWRRARPRGWPNRGKGRSAQRPLSLIRFDSFGEPLSTRNRPRANSRRCPVAAGSRQVSYELDEALELLADLEDGRDCLIESGHLTVVLALEAELRASSLSWVSPIRGKPMSAELLRASQAARRLGIPTRDLVPLIYDRKIRHVMVNGIAHVPEDAIEEYLRRSAS